MTSTLKSRPATHTHAAATGSGVHLAPSRGVQPKPVAARGGFAAGIASAPRVALQRKQLHAAFGHAIQRQAGPEEEELLQGKFSTLQRQAGPEEEELLQGKFDAIQRQGPEEEELPQGKFATREPPTQLQSEDGPKENNTGLPDNLKAGIENLSGMSMDDVNVHCNSSKPGQLNALAYTQGADIHVGPGQEQHIPHEGWHVVQQKQARVNPMFQVKGVSINDDAALEHEADVMGTKALQMRRSEKSAFEFSIHQAIQRVAAPVNPLNINATHIQAIVVNAINAEIHNSRPKIYHHKSRITFVWRGAVTFPNGTTGDLGLNIHVDDADRWACGSAWIEGVVGVSFNMAGLTPGQQGNIDAYTKYWDSSESFEDEYEDEYLG